MPPGPGPLVRDPETSDLVSQSRIYSSMEHLTLNAVPLDQWFADHYEQGYWNELRLLQVQFPEYRHVATLPQDEGSPLSGRPLLVNLTVLNAPDWRPSDLPYMDLANLLYELRGPVYTDKSLKELEARDEWDYVPAGWRADGPLDNLSLVPCTWSSKSKAPWLGAKRFVDDRTHWANNGENEYIRSERLDSVYMALYKMTRSALLTWTRTPEAEDLRTAAKDLATARATRDRAQRTMDRSRRLLDRALKDKLG